MRFTRKEGESESESQRKSKTLEFAITNNNDDNILLSLQHRNIMQENR